MIRRQLPEPPLQYLRETSDTGLREFLLRKLNEADIRRKEVRDVLEEWVQAEALAMLSEWIRELRQVDSGVIGVVPPPMPPRRATKMKAMELPPAAAD